MNGAFVEVEHPTCAARVDPGKQWIEIEHPLRAQVFGHSESLLGRKDLKCRVLSHGGFVGKTGEGSGGPAKGLLGPFRVGADLMGRYGA